MEIGDKLDGRFEITEKVRETPDGTEYSATDTYGHVVRIRELDVAKLADWDAVQVFEKKAKLLERLTNPGLPQYVDYFADESGAAAGYFLAYSCADGKTLADIATGKENSNGDELKKALIESLKILDYIHTFSLPLTCPNISADTVAINADTGAAFCCTEFVPLAPGRDSSIDLKELGRAFAGAVKTVYGADDSPLRRELNEIIGLMIASGYESRPVTAARLAETLAREPKPQGQVDPQPQLRDQADLAENEYKKPFEGQSGASFGIAKPGNMKISEGYRTSGLRFANHRVGKPESLVAQVLLNLWLGKPWVVILIAAFLSGGPLFIPLLILHLYPGARAWMKKRYAKYCEVEIRIDDSTVTVPNQVDRTRVENIDRIEYLTYREENELRLEVTMTQIDGEQKKFYLSGISEDDVHQIRGFLNRHVE